MTILLVKLGALGDVLRTTPLLPALKRRYPECRITWLVHPSHREILERNPFIDERLSYGQDTLKQLALKKFDLAINLDKDEEALDAVMAAQAVRKLGFGRDASGQLCALNPESEYAYRLGVDDELKFRKNQKSYQEISFEQVGLLFQKEEYIFELPEESVLRAKKNLAALGVDTRFHEGLVVGLNTGSGARFAGKKLPIESCVRLAESFSRHLGATVLLLGGKDEEERNRQIEEMAKTPVVNTGIHSIQDFAAIVKECDIVVSGDTTAMHIAIAVKVPTVVFFGSTCAAEIELYGRGRKIISDLPCAPCYLRDCPIGEECMSGLDPENIFQAACEFLEATPKK